MAELRFAPPTPDTAAGAVRIEGLRDARYGEVFLVRTRADRVFAEVWNTLGLNDCPQDAWDALDIAQIAEANGALAAILNGPRHWLLDAIENVPPAERRTATFGSIDMFLAAAIDLGTELPSPTPYTVRRIERNTVWEWSAGRDIHELVDPDGNLYVMQAYCLAVEPTLTQAALFDIGDRISPPQGWNYRSRRVDDVLRVSAHDGVGLIIQDDLQNTYHRV